MSIAKLCTGLLESKSWIMRFAEIAWFIAALCIAYVLTPIVTVDHVTQGKEILLPSLPVTSWNTKDPIEITAHIKSNPWQIPAFTISPDDCLEKLQITGYRTVTKACKYRTIDRAKSYLLASGAVITAKIVDTAGPPSGINIFPLQSHWKSLLPRVMIALMIGWISLRFLWCISWKNKEIFSIGFAGIFARIFYGITTDYDVRSYDFNAHLEYVKHLSKNFSLPPASGWEFHQPPLYYALDALFVRFGHLFGWSLPMIIPWIQLFSIAIACATFVAALWIGKQVFAREDSRRFLLYAALLAGLPGLVMFSSRISNDILVTLEIFLGAGILLQWWKNPRRRDWYLLWLLSGIAFLTKLNGLTLPIALIILALIRWKRGPSLRQWAGGLAIFFALTFWLPVLRLQERPSDVRNLIMTGKAGITHALKIKRLPEDFLTFNPVSLISHPFNTPYSDEGRRSNALEYLFRSALFGEFSNFSVKWITKDVLLLALLLLPWMGLGLISTRLKIERDDFPLFVVCITTLMLWVAYISIFHFSPEQDFRFSPFFGVGGAYFIAQGIESGPKRYRMIGRWSVMGLFALSTLMLLL